MKIFLVDGTFELFRAYYAGLEAKSQRGVEIGAALGVARSMLALARDEAPCHMAIAFDHVIESFRNDLFAGYKTGEGIDSVLYAQFPIVEELLMALGFKVWPMVAFEADDALATGAIHFDKDPEVSQVVICSPDKDLCQVVKGSRIITWDRIRKTRRTAPDVEAKFGVPPKAIPDLLALVGDSADGVPGVPKWGMKSSATVLSAHRHLEAIPHSLDEWQVKPRGAAVLLQSLTDHWDEALLYKKLTTLRRDVPLPHLMASDLLWQGPNIGTMKEWAHKLPTPTLEQLHKMATQALEGPRNQPPR